MHRPIHAFTSIFWIALVLCMAAISCTKTNFEDVQVVQELPEHETVFLMDCEELDLNIGDTCHVESDQFGYVMGFVNEDCDCDADASGEEITIVIESNLFWNSNITVQASPSFIAGPSSFEAHSGLTLQQYLFEEGTTECTLTVSYTCGPSGFMFFPEIILTGTPINGVVGPLVIDC